MMRKAASLGGVVAMDGASVIERLANNILAVCRQVVAHRGRQVLVTS